jgi:hypothetical protein
MLEIRSQQCAQGSYRLQRINPETGQRLGETITVWHVIVDGECIDTFLTRDAARKFAREYTRKSDD